MLGPEEILVQQLEVVPGQAHRPSVPHRRPEQRDDQSRALCPHVTCRVHVSRVTCSVSPPEHEVEDEVEHPDVVLLHDLQHSPHVIRQVRVGPDSFCNKY